MIDYIKQGDCLELMKEIPDGSVDMILCDLPYGTTRNKWDSVIPFEPLWKQYKRIVKKNGAIVLFGSEPFATQLRHSNLKMFKYDWIWKKPHTGQLNAKRMPLKNVETISLFSQGRSTYNPQFSYSRPYMIARKNYKGSECYGKQSDHATVSDGRRYPTQILEYAHDSLRFHPTQKPVALLEYLIKTYTNEGETVLDNCMGSGSTCVAAINTGRHYVGFALDPGYCEIARKRIEEAGGGDA